jgi:serine/threonine-protein kinase RsbW
MFPMSSLRLPAKLENLNELIGFLNRCARDRGASEKRLHEIELASEEALVNIIRYAYAGKESGEVEVTCRPESDTAWIIEFRDWGVPFDATAYPEPDLKAPISDRKVGGLGISIIRKMVSQISYRREEGSNILTFVVRRDT